MKRFITIICAAMMLCANIYGKEPQEPASYNYQRGVECIKNNNSEEGKRYLQKELQQNHKNGYAYSWLAVAYMTEEELGNAIYYLEQAQKYLPKADKTTIAWTHKLRALIYLDMQDTVNCLQEYALAIKYDPKDENYYLERGGIYRELKQWNKSDADFRQFVKLTPGLIRGLMELGENLMLQNKYEEALDTYRYAHKLASRAYTFSAMASAELKLGQYEQAAEHIVNALEEDIHDDKAGNIIADCKDSVFVEILLPKIEVKIRRHPNVVGWIGYKAGLYLHLKQYYDAIDGFQQLRSVTAEPSVDGMIAKIYQQIGDMPNALRMSQIAIEGDSTAADLVFRRMNIYFEMDSVAQCLQDAQWLIEHHPETANSYFIRGQLYFYLKEYQKAVEDLTLGLAIDPKENYGSYLRGRSYLAWGDSAHAKKDFEHIYKESTNGIIRAFSAIHLGYIEEAKVLTDSVLIADTVTHEERYNIACAYSLLGDSEKAFEILEEALKNEYLEFRHLRLDPDFVPIHGPRFDSLVDFYETRVQENIRNHAQATDSLLQETRIVEIPFSSANGVTKVDCTINGLPLNFIFDTGASDVSLSQVEANFMFKNGYLSDKDVMGKQRYQTADGNISIGTVINISQINFGGLELNNVRASVVKSQNAPLLLGQSILQRLGKIEIDNERRVLIITTKQ